MLPFRLRSRTRVRPPWPRSYSVRPFRLLVSLGDANHGRSLPPLASVPLASSGDTRLTSAAPGPLNAVYVQETTSPPFTANTSSCAILQRAPTLTRYAPTATTTMRPPAPHALSSKQDRPPGSSNNCKNSALSASADAIRRKNAGITNASNVNADRSDDGWWRKGEREEDETGGIRRSDYGHPTQTPADTHPSK